MPKFPNPPPVERLVELGADQRVVPDGTALFRVYFRGGDHPATWNGFRHFGPIPSGRFDHHLGPPRLQSRGILYVAWHPRTCLAEVFQAKRRIDVLSRSPLLVGFEVVRPIPLLDLTGFWPARAGASTAISSGPRVRAQAWHVASTMRIPGSKASSTARPWMPAHPARRCSSAPVTPYPPCRGSIARWSTRSCARCCNGRPSRSTTTSCDRT